MFLQSSHSVVEELLFLVFQRAICCADNVLVVRNFVSFHEFFKFRKKQNTLGARATYLITRQLKHWLPSKMLAMNYSITHCIRHSYSYSTANGWLEDQEQQFFYNGIRALGKCWTRCILVKKSQNTTCISSSKLCQSMNFLNAPCMADAVKLSCLFQAV